MKITHDKPPNALRVNRIRCIFAVFVCALLCIMVFLGVCIQLLSEPNPEIPEVGWESYYLFTILSSMLMAFAAAMCIPYTVDGIRYHNYHLPRWYVDLMFMGTTGVTVTFLSALTVLAPAAGFYRVMIWSNNIFLHTICPILSILLFIFINSDHKIKLRSSFIAVIPVTVYAVVYLIMVFAIGEESGGWRDIYRIRSIADSLPLPLLLIIFFLLSFGIANVLRVIHNFVHVKRKSAIEKYYQQADAFSYPDIQSAIKSLADMDRPNDKGGELTVPRRVMMMMEKKYHSGLTVREMCELYIRSYYQHEDGDRE